MFGINVELNAIFLNFCFSNDKSSYLYWINYKQIWLYTIQCDWFILYLNYASKMMSPLSEKDYGVWNMGPNYTLWIFSISKTLDLGQTLHLMSNACSE
jgi:hypothetical protein